MPARRRVFLRLLRWSGSILLVAMAALAANGCSAFGKRPAGARLARIERSAQWKGGRFENPQPLQNDMWGAMTSFGEGSPHRTPVEPVPVVRTDPAALRTAPASGLRVTWLGHSTFLVELDGRRVLTDPVWSRRPSPFSFVGPTRFFEPPIALGDLPPLDAVVISHDHYDHLDLPTIEAMRGWKVPFVVPLGVGAHLAHWGIPEERIVELDWWERTQIGDLAITCTPARHASGRGPSPVTNRTLWSGFALTGPSRRAFFSGDTGLFPDLAAIGERLGPFDVTMIEAGAYGRWWPDWHLGPEQALQAHAMVRGGVLVPAHWGTFNLAYHAWTEPAERLLAEADRIGAAVAIPRPGQSFEPVTTSIVERWWPRLPTRTAAQDPIVSTRVNGRGAL